MFKISKIILFAGCLSQLILGGCSDTNPPSPLSDSESSEDESPVSPPDIGVRRAQFPFLMEDLRRAQEAMDREEEARKEAMKREKKQKIETDFDINNLLFRYDSKNNKTFIDLFDNNKYCISLECSGGLWSIVCKYIKEKRKLWSSFAYDSECEDSPIASRPRS